MTRILLRLLAAIFTCLAALAAANVAMAANLSTNHGSDAAAAAAPVKAQPDPGSLKDYRDRVGKTLVFTVTGTTDGSVYGEGVYTDDSQLSTAAVHAGIVKPGETKDVRVEIMPGQQSYQGALDFGVSSSSYGAWDGSYKFLDKAMSEADIVLPDPGKLSGYRSKVGETLQFQVTGSADSAVWGDGVYTDDSTLGTAAVHAGLVKDGEDGTVTVKIMAGQAKYSGSSRNGVVSQAYGKWDGSFEFLDSNGKPVLSRHK